ncbi:Ser-Thr-rich glycosyl-phosphatidyl-inositol-anchored membrane family-domain-containing protein [Lipomyces tetrasporus]|uniref:Ser-Thr-rich glycosyl-phosphatidyl-inositol-anchored membrane family-domain-containing protein n=1 Tax=Lipomyces tetrasporus TaxID=54092 RepID=A0AAD7QNV7_9ASCO|nr:Ser-Thr-rich glycosyl-phosphatidyl-inositol-anchored membrane family-domain-containing protein [Lipomyces tetrasporus]KAJ8098719.1 Ser-Thr-rich glycosyl-phosphatidyl-inositol-anchored membrane family-domain-containing protein [Lipomyces tetrasporus]
MVLLSNISLFILCALVALVSAASNPISSPTTGDTLTTGQPFLVEWKPSNNHTISLFLKKGPPSNLQSVLTIITNLPNTGIVRWTPPPRIYTGKDYTITIQDDITGDTNYSNQFGIKGRDPVSSTSSSAAPTRTSKTSTSSSTSSTSSSTPSRTTASSRASSTTSSSSRSTATANANTSPTRSSSSAQATSWTNSTSASGTSSTPSTLSELIVGSTTTTSGPAVSTTISAIGGASKVGYANTVAVVVALVFGYLVVA